MHQQQAVWGRFPNKCELVLERGRQRGEGLERGRAEQWNITLKLGELAAAQLWGLLCKVELIYFHLMVPKCIQPFFEEEKKLEGFLAKKYLLDFPPELSFLSKINRAFKRTLALK